uniref:methyltransferase domain-containing protein n=1 Tax=uncultured Chloroflexus sp. TaxID=214040 RepID=UPI00345D0282
MLVKRGFLIYDAELDDYRVDELSTLSILANELLLELILSARAYMKGRLLDVGCGKRPYSLIYDQLVAQSIGTEVVYSPHGVQAADLICLGEQLPFVDGAFDTVLCTEVLEH